MTLVGAAATDPVLVASVAATSATARVAPAERRHRLLDTSGPVTGYGLLSVCSASNVNVAVVVAP